MAIITKGYTFNAGAVVVASKHNTNLDTLYNDYNGNITNANLSASAGIVDTKLAQITTAGKVSGIAIANYFPQCWTMWHDEATVITGNALSYTIDLTQRFNTQNAYAEKITNGTFTGNADGWTLEGLYYGSNKVSTLFPPGYASCEAKQLSGNMVTPMVIGETYRLTFTISDLTSGSFFARCGFTNLGYITTNGTHTYDFICSRAPWFNLLFLELSSTSGLSVDDVSLKEITLNGDSFSNSFFLKSGTYNFNVLGITDSDYGKIDWYIDGTKAVSVQDWYSANPVKNVVKTASVTVVGDGYHKLVGTINGKNDSSSAYYVVLTKYWLQPATDGART